MAEVAQIKGAFHSREKRKAPQERPRLNIPLKVIMWMAIILFFFDFTIEAYSLVVPSQSDIATKFGPSLAAIATLLLVSFMLGTQR